jgi:hypothetical protein
MENDFRIKSKFTTIGRKMSYAFCKTFSKKKIPMFRCLEWAENVLVNGKWFPSQQHNYHCREKKWLMPLKRCKLFSKACLSLSPPPPSLRTTTPHILVKEPSFPFPCTTPLHLSVAIPITTHSRQHNIILFWLRQTRLFRKSPIMVLLSHKHT